MGLTTPTRLRIALVGAAAALGLALPGAASAATTIAAAAPDQYNTTPSCPVSPTDTVCAWSVPVDAGNLFTSLDYGQCPYWAVEKYPALVVDELAGDPLGDDWDGGTWLEHAQAEGLSTSTTPASGDLAVWQANPSDPDGHVAYVEAVLADGAIVVSQMDGNSSAPFPALSGSTEYLDSGDLSYFAQSYGLEYIATGDPSSTPISDVLDPSATTPSSSAAPAASASAPTPTAAPGAIKPQVAKHVRLTKPTASGPIRHPRHRRSRTTPGHGARTHRR